MQGFTSLYVCSKAEEYSLVTENTPPSVASGTIFLMSMIYNLNINKRDKYELDKYCCRMRMLTYTKLINIVK